MEDCGRLLTRSHRLCEMIHRVVALLLVAAFIATIGLGVAEAQGGGLNQVKTLICDDLKKGKPTVWRKYGYRTAAEACGAVRRKLNFRNQGVQKSLARKGMKMRNLIKRASTIAMRAEELTHVESVFFLCEYLFPPVACSDRSDAECERIPGCDLALGWGAAKDDNYCLAA